nr:ComEC/Rec2 family competence protein [Acidobacteriota bacterium]
MKRPQVWRNPGSASESWQRLRRGSDISGSIKSGSLVAVTRGPWWKEAGARVRAHVRHTLGRTVGPSSPESASIVTAILIGDRTGLDDQTVRRLQSAGTYHVIAISGGNIAIVVIACLMLLRFVMRSARMSAAITLGVVLAYGALVGDQASVSRAVTAGALVLGLQVAGWCAPTLQVFALAALGVAVRDPLTVVDVGAWLSFGATLGILLFGRDLHRRISPSRGWLMGAAAAMFAATLAAELALMPISAAVFSRVSVAGLLLNFIAIPAMAVTQLAGTAIVIVADLWPWLGGVAALVAHAGAAALVRSTGLLDLMPWLSWQTPPVWWGWTLIYYVGLLGPLFRRGPRQARVSMTVAAAGAWLVIVCAPNSPARLPPPGYLRVSMLDVGQGQSVAVQFPTGQSLLVDAGGTGTRFDIGARVVEPALWALGMQRLDWLALTHGDGDHVGGAASVMRDMAPREVWEGVPVPRDRRLQSLRERAHSQGTVWRRLLAGSAFEAGSALVEVVHPPPPDWERQFVRNDDSLVLRVTFGQVSLLLTGDVGLPVEENMTFDQSPRLRLVTAPHHGSRTSSSDALVR